MPIALVWTEATHRIAVEHADGETPQPGRRRGLHVSIIAGLAGGSSNTNDEPASPSIGCSDGRVPNPFASLDPILKRDGADILFIAGNVALVAFDLIDWPITALMLASHAMARSRHKVLQAVAEVAEEAG